MKSVRQHLQEKLKDVHFKEVYELDQLKFALIKPIVEYRIKNNLTQKQLADEVGVTQQYISKIENGVFSDMEMVAEILHHIGLQIKKVTVKFKQIKSGKKYVKA